MTPACWIIFDKGACIKLDDILEYYEPVLREMLSEKRLKHSIFVAQRAEYLAKIYGCDIKKAYTAGLLHDIMKDKQSNEQLQWITDFGILFDPVKLACPKVWHSTAGALYIRERLCLKDPEILDAVTYHTTGRPDMSLLEKIIFLADYTSEDRKFKEAGVVREASEQDLDQAMLLATGYVIEELVEKQSPICADTIEAYNQLALKKEKNHG